MNRSIHQGVSGDDIPRFQVISDLHSEFLDAKTFDKCLIKPVAENLILAGDIGKLNTPMFKQLFDYFSNKWKSVVYVPGNHEYYLKRNFHTLNQMYSSFFEQYPNVTWMNNDVLDTDRYIIIGSTLWSAPQMVNGLNDFNLIKYNNRKMTKEVFHTLHQRAVDFLKTALQHKSCQNKICVVVTHFPPIRKNTSAPEYAESPHMTYFANDLKEMGLDAKNVDIWVSGHTHHSYDFQLNGTRFVANQIGYPGELDPSFTKVVEAPVH